MSEKNEKLFCIANIEDWITEGENHNFSHNYNLSQHYGDQCLF